MTVKEERTQLSTGWVPQDMSSVPASLSCLHNFVYAVEQERPASMEDPVKILEVRAAAIGRRSCRTVHCETVAELRVHPGTVKRGASLAPLHGDCEVRGMWVSQLVNREDWFEPKCINKKCQKRICPRKDPLCTGEMAPALFGTIDVMDATAQARMKTGDKETVRNIFGVKVERINAVRAWDRTRVQLRQRCLTRTRLPSS